MKLRVKIKSSVHLNTNPVAVSERDKYSKLFFYKIIPKNYNISLIPSILVVNFINLITIYF